MILISQGRYNARNKEKIKEEEKLNVDERHDDII